MWIYRYIKQHGFPKPVRFRRSHGRWTLELLARELVGLIAHDSVSRETVRRRLAENPLKPWRKNMWCIPQVDAEYVGAWRMCSISMPKPPIPSTR